MLSNFSMPLLMRKYFLSKKKQLLALTDQVVTEHAVLKGTHREEVINLYLKDILPKRLSIGKGMIYDSGNKQSKESDIVIWDELNYPSLPMFGHNLFFVESVRAVLEVKSSWSSSLLTKGKEGNVLDKCESVKNLDVVYGYHPLLDVITQVHRRICQCNIGDEHSNQFFTMPRPAFATIFLKGKGFSLSQHFDILSDECIQQIWPDIILFLETGQVIVKGIYKSESASTNMGFIEEYNAGDDALMFFTSKFIDWLDITGNLTQINYFEEYAKSANTLTMYQPKDVRTFRWLSPSESYEIR